ncbi:MAG: helix-turn-helix domain-containing protein, partial [Candidatus Curtissbacteria bacterium]
MQQLLGTTLLEKRQERGISIEKAANDLLIKKEHLQALEKGDWQSLPEPPFVRGFIKNYGQYLGLDTDRLQALYRREYDVATHPSANLKHRKPQRIIFTPSTIVTFASLIVVALFAIYLIVQYLSITSGPKLEVFAPPADITTSAPVVQVEGKTDPGATVVVNGQFAPVDEDGNFAYQYTLEDGQNIIEIIASL